MRPVSRLLTATICLGVLASAGPAKGPKGKSADTPKKAAAGSAAADAIVERMMAFDKNKDGKLSRDEITDGRLLRLFDRADKNKDGVVTREELTALANEMAAEQAAGGGRFGGPGGFGPPGGGGPGGFGPPKFGKPPRPGQVLPSFLADRLGLTDDQKKEIQTLQSEVDARLAKILTEDQRKRLKEMRPPRKGGPDGPGGPGGPKPPPPDKGGPGEPPPPPDQQARFEKSAEEPAALFGRRSN